MTRDNCKVRRTRTYVLQPPLGYVKMWLLAVPSAVAFAKDCAAFL